MFLFVGCSSSVSNVESSPSVDSEFFNPDNAPVSDNFIRLFDNVLMSEKAEKVLQVFAPCSMYNWDSINNEQLLKTVYFKYYVERMYQFDTGKNFDHDEQGFTDINNYIVYADKYFGLTEEQVRKELCKSNIYNAENDTVFMSDGLGCVIGVQFVDFTELDDCYVIDYTITSPENTQYEYAKLYFTENTDGSFKIIKNEYTGTTYTPSYKLEKFDEPVATSKDKKYELYYGYGYGGGEFSCIEVVLKDVEQNKFKSLGFIRRDLITDVGFFSNGDVYTFEKYGLNVYNTDMSDSSIIFTTKTNFNGGYSSSFSGERYIFAIRRDPEKLDYIVVYTECGYPVDIKENNFQLKANYKVGLLDKEGNLVQSWDTGVPVMYSAFGFETVYMTKPSETEIEFFVRYKDEERLRGRFNLESGVYTPIKTFELSTDAELENVRILAEKQLPILHSILGFEWDPDTTEFSLYAVATPLRLYYELYNAQMPYVPAKPNDYLVSEAYRISNLMNMMTKYFSFSEENLLNYYRSSDRYDPEYDSVFIGDGWGWPFMPEVTEVNRVGENYAIYYNLIDLDGNVAERKMITAKLTDQGHLKFIENVNME